MVRMAEERCAREAEVRTLMASIPDDNDPEALRLELRLWRSDRLDSDFDDVQSMVAHQRQQLNTPYLPLLQDWLFLMSGYRGNPLPMIETISSWFPAEYQDQVYAGLAAAASTGSRDNRIEGVDWFRLRRGLEWMDECSSLNNTQRDLYLREAYRNGDEQAAVYWFDQYDQRPYKVFETLFAQVEGLTSIHAIGWVNQIAASRLETAER